MSAPDGDGLADLPIAVVEQVDQLCARFEAAWQQGARPSLEDFLAPAPAVARSVLLAELLALEVEYRRQRGERPAPADYVARFPDDGALIRACCAEPAGRRAELPQLPG